ncbi:MAG: hypothetical protein NVSMB47_01910 [Polyangiales bacterium]
MTRGGAGALLVTVGIVVGCSGEIRFSSLDGGRGPVGADSGLAAADDVGIDAPASACDVDADCVVSSLHCDAVAHECVPCVVDAHCADPAMPRCDTAAHECVECGVEGDCKVGQTCVTATHKCVGHCTATNKICPAAAPICDVARGLCIGCASAADCTSDAARPVCEVASGRCVQCAADADCFAPGKPRCDLTSGACVRCTSGRDCPIGAQICEPDKHVCVAK